MHLKVKTIRLHLYQKNNRGVAYGLSLVFLLYMVIDYLYCNTKLETPSSSRYDFGKLYKNETHELCFKLNLQVRFK